MDNAIRVGHLFESNVWQKQLAANAALAFDSPWLSSKKDEAKDRKIVALDSEDSTKNKGDFSENMTTAAVSESTHNSNARR